MGTGPSSQRLQGRPPTATLAAALATYEAAGGVLDYVAFDVVSSPSLSDHEEAATRAMAAIRLKLERPPSGFQLKVSGAPGPSIAVSARDFVGPFYDWKTERLVSPWVDGTRGLGGDFVTHGYADAFLEPPYSLRCTLDQATSLFQCVNTELFGRLSDELEIRSWSTDWSNYFDSGLEWWGAFYWTVYSPTVSRLVVVGASSTD
jgi:hypothetical protein